jgi:hypothetical protein
MDDLAQEVVDKVKANGGSMTFVQLKAALSPEKWPGMPRATKIARAENKLTQDVKLVDGKTVLTYYSVEA